MKPMLLYIVEVLFCSGLFLALYRLILARRVSFSLCRRYLLAAMLAAVVIPALRIPVYLADTLYYPVPLIMAQETPADVFASDSAALTLASEPIGSIDWPSVLRMMMWGFYGLVAALMVVLALWRIRSIRRLRRASHLTPCERYTLAEHERVKAPFSFLHTIFLGMEYTPCERAQIICHEASHVRHRHSAERLAMETLRCLFWFNPFVWIAGRQLAEVQEWEADRDVLDAGYDLTEYRTTIFHQLFGYHQDITCGLNYSFTKNRFIMMTQFKKGKFTLVRCGAVVTIMAGMMMLCSFTSRAPKIVYEEAAQGVAARDTTLVFDSSDGRVHIKADRVLAVKGDSTILFVGNVCIFLGREKWKMQSDSAIRYAGGRMECFNNVILETKEKDTFLSDYVEVNYDKDGKINWRMTQVRVYDAVPMKPVREVEILKSGAYILDDTPASLDQIEAALAAIPEEQRTKTMMLISADDDTPMSAVDALRQRLRSVGVLYVRYLTESASAVDRVLSPAMTSAPQEPQKVEVMKIKERNLVDVRVNSKGHIFAGPLGKQQLVSVENLTVSVRTFIDNAEASDALSEKKTEVFELPDGTKWSYPVSQGFISLQMADETSYYTYIAVQNAILAAYAELRDEAAQSAFGKPYAALDKAQTAVINRAVPIHLSEAELHITQRR